MELTLKKGVLSITDGAFGAQNSSNVNITLRSDMTGYSHSIAVKYVNTDGKIKEVTLKKSGGKWLMPADVYMTSQVVMVSVSAATTTETFISNPMYVRVEPGTNGGTVLPSNAATWQEVVRAYLDTVIGVEYNATTKKLTIHTNAYDGSDLESAEGASF